MHTIDYQLLDDIARDNALMNIEVKGLYTPEVMIKVEAIAAARGSGRAAA